MKLLRETTTSTKTFEYAKNIILVLTQTGDERRFVLVNTDEGTPHATPRLVRNDIFEWLKSHNPFADYVDGEAVFRDFVVSSWEEYETNTENTTLLWFCVYDHTLYLQDYTPVPFPLDFNYLLGNCSSDNFNLKESVKTLERMENVTCVSISKVGWYNQNNKEDLMSLNFRLLPTVEMLQHIQILEKTQNYVDRNAEFTRMLGLVRIERLWK